MTMQKTQSQKEERVWVACRSKSPTQGDGEAGCGGQEAIVMGRRRTPNGNHIVMFKCVRCGRPFHTMY